MRYIPTLRVPSRGSRVMTAGNVMKGAASSGQQVWIGQPPEVDVVAGQDDFLRTAGPDALRHRVGDRLQLRQALHLRDEALRRLHLEHVAHPRADLVEARGVEGQAHPPLRPELVDQERVLGALDVLEQERGAARP